MSASGSGPYERNGEGGRSDGRPPRGQDPLVQVPSVPLVQEGPPRRVPRLDLRAAIGALAEWFGIDPVTFEGPCPLPRHEGRARLAAGLPEDPTGDVRLLCCRGRWRSLGEVLAAIGYGEDHSRRSNIEIAVWTRRLAYEVGAFSAAEIAVPPLAPGASPAIEQAREGFRLLIGLRWADGPHVAVPFTVRFAGAWCGLGHGTAHHAINALIERGVIYEADHHGRIALYLPGPKPDGVAGARDAEAREDALVARIIEAFDAEELPAQRSDEETLR